MLLQPAQREGRRFLNPVPTNLGGPSIMFKIGPRFFLGARARSPQQVPGPFRTDPSVYATQPRSGLRITWMGHSTSIVEIDGVRILIDPVWDLRAAPLSWAGPKRFFPPPLMLHELPTIDAVIISHDHYDHLGASTIRALAQLPVLNRARWIMPLGVAALVKPLGVPAVQCSELNWMDSETVGAVKITALPARHFSGRSLFNRFHTLWASFALAGPEHRVYYGADSGEWAGLTKIGEQFGPFDLSMLEIGASNTLWEQIHLGPEGAARSFAALGGRGLLMPIHWGLFDLALHYWKEPIETMWSIPGVALWSPAPGTPSDVFGGEELRSDWWR